MIPLVLFLLACLAVYVGIVEAAFSALMRLSLRLIAERRGRSDLLDRYLDDPMRLFVPARVLLGIIFSLATVLLAVQIGSVGLQRVGALLLAVAVFILVSEHLLPLLIVRRDPERVLEVLLPSFDLFVTLLRPLTLPLVGLARTDRRDRPDAGPPNSEPPPPAADAGGSLEGAAPPEGFDRDERRLLQSIVAFADTFVREVMTPRPDIVAVRSDATLSQLRALFAEQEYSRIPVYKDNLDNILGFVFVKDLILLSDDEGGEAISGLIRPAYVVPETKRVAELLREFQRRQVQVAIVVDEYGGTAGLVALEDLLEELVGEIRDEYDVESEPIVDEGNGVFVLSGKVDIDRAADLLGVEIEPEGFETVGGFVLARVGRVPAVGETFEIDRLGIEVLEAERRRVHKVRVRGARAEVRGPGAEVRGSTHK